MVKTAGYVVKNTAKARCLAAILKYTMQYFFRRLVPWRRRLTLAPDYRKVFPRTGGSTADDELHYAASIIGLLRRPIFSISTSATSPVFMKIGGVRFLPTPPGEPVRNRWQRLTSDDRRPDAARHIFRRAGA